MVATHILPTGLYASTETRDPITRIEGIMGGRPVIRGTRITVASVKGRLSGGDSIEDLMLDYPDVPRAAFEAAATHEAERDATDSRPHRPGE